MATFWERAAHSVKLFFLCIMSICYFGFQGGTVVLSVQVPGHC